MTTEPPIAAGVIREASRWLMLHWQGGLRDRQRAAFEAWCAASPEHRRAWERLSRLETALAGAPRPAARALAAAPDRRRRTVLKQLALVGAAGGGLWLAEARLPWRPLLADQRTNAGEVRHLTLADGSRLSLNSGSAVDIRFTAGERRLHLLAGELLLESGPHQPGRPLRVTTAAGEVEALGTRFALRREGEAVRVELFEGELAVRPRAGPGRRLGAGQGLWFTAGGAGPVEAADPDAIAWHQGLLVAERQPLGAFLAELARHRPGVIRCDPAVADLPLTGVFPLADTDRVLAGLPESLPVAVDYRTRYWVSVGPARD